MHVTAIPDWLDFPDVDKPYVELIYDRREPKVSPRRRHALLQARVSVALDRWAGDRGEVGTEWRCYLIDGETKPSSLLADVSYYSFARLPRELEEDARERPRIAPDIAVEIFSPGDRRKTLEQKIDLYLRHGATVVIVIDPQQRTIVMHQQTGKSVFEARGTLAVPGYDDLTLDCDDLFRGL
jgi:Uma2 family endonuclease